MGLRPVHIDCRDFTDGSQTHLTVTNRAVTTEPSPQAIGGQSSMAVTKASPETRVLEDLAAAFGQRTGRLPISTSGAE
jgi:hypothetical protein